MVTKGFDLEGVGPVFVVFLCQNCESARAGVPETELLLVHFVRNCCHSYRRYGSTRAKGATAGRLSEPLRPHEERVRVEMVVTGQVESWRAWRATPGRLSSEESPVQCGVLSSTLKSCERSNQRFRRDPQSMPDHDALWLCRHRHVRYDETNEKPSSSQPALPPIIFFTLRPSLARLAAARSAPLQCGPAQ